MSLSKRWWYLVLVGVVIGLGIIFFRNELVNNDKGVTTDKTSVTDQKAQVVVGQKLVNLEKQVRGEVVNWEGKKSELTFKIIDSQEIKKTIVDSDKMSLFIPESQHKTNAVLPLVKGDRNWETAFCPQDTLTVGYDSSGEIKLLFNTGYRMCGFKGE